MYILDSDHFTLFMLGHPEVVRRVNERGSEVAISIITVEEELSGWYTRLRKSNNSERLIRAYAGMYRAVQHFKITRRDAVLARCYATIRGTPKDLSADREIGFVDRRDCPGIQRDLDYQKPDRLRAD